MKKKFFQITSLGFLAIFTLYSCGNDDSSSMDPNDCPTTVTYTSDVRTIFQTNCTTSGCHNANTSAAGLDFSSYTSAVASVEASDFLCAVNHNSGCIPMPIGAPKLSDANISRLTCWVQTGLTE